MPGFRLVYRCTSDPGSLPHGDTVAMVVEETDTINAIITARRESLRGVPGFVPCAHCTLLRAEPYVA